MRRSVVTGVEEDREASRAVVMVQIRGRWRSVAVIGADQRCDLELVDQLARLALQTRRAGSAMRLGDVCAELRGLLRLAGLDDLFEPEPLPDPDGPCDEFSP